MTDLILKPIGHFHSPKTSPVEAARQATADHSGSVGIIELLPGNNFEQALEDLEGFSHLWVIYGFHLNSQWKPKVDPPRGPGHKVGVFASRSPYRPNPLGISALPLLKIDGLQLTVGAHDILEGSPIYDLKPYLPYSDSIPEARLGWTKNLSDKNYKVIFRPIALTQLQFLHDIGGLTEMQGAIENQLQFEPLNSQKKRVKPDGVNKGIFAIKTWRARFEINHDQLSVDVLEIFSGYSPEDLDQNHPLFSDPYLDKDLHRNFIRRFAG